MNVEGAAVEREIGRTIMPCSCGVQPRHGRRRGGGGAAAGLGVAVSVHLAFASVLVVGVPLAVVRGSCPPGRRRT